MFAQPVVSNGGILNAASYALNGLPNSGIAEGSMFVVFGTGLGPAALAANATPFPLSTAVGGTSVQVTVAGSKYDVFMIYSTATQVAGVLPSSVPVGTGTLTVTYNGQTSAAVSVKVVQSAFGIFTVNQQGSGPGSIQNYNSATDTPTNSIVKPVKPGQVMILWGTGVGPVTGNEAAGPIVSDMSASVKLWVGSTQAAVLYAGRSPQFGGIDQINFTVPDATPDGCHVPVAVQIGNVVSNYATIAVSRTGATCTDLISLSSDQITKAQTNGSYSQGLITLNRINAQVTFGGLGTLSVVSDQGTGSFGRYTATQLLSASYPVGFVSTVGVCNVFTFKGTGIQFPSDPVQAASLDAGAVINVNGPNGAKQMVKGTSGGYSALLGGIDLNTLATSKNYLNPGSYTIDNGTGGTGANAVGAFKTTLTLGQPVTWTNQSPVATVDRTKPLQLTWTGGDPNGYVAAFGLAATTGASAGFFCSAKASEGAVTIPPAVLLSLPVDSGGYIGVLGASANTPFTAAGLDSGAIVVLNSNVKTAAYQ